MKTLRVLLKNNDIFTYEPGSYDRYVIGDTFFIVYLDDVVVTAFNVDCILMIDIYDEDEGGMIYD